MTDDPQPGKRTPGSEAGASRPGDRASRGARGGPSLFALAGRALVLLSLITQAAQVYLVHRLVRRGWIRGSDDWLEARAGRFAARFVRVATSFRGGLIKLGQVASLRVDVLPESMTRELVRLQDRVPPHPFDEIDRQIRHELGRPARALFAEFAEAPVASASLGQVHRARDHAGRDLAVKVLYPGVERSVAVDLRMARFAIWLFNPLVLPDLRSVHEQIVRSIRGEMDYLAEGAAAERVAANLAKDPALAEHVRIPRIHWETTARRVLTMEFIDGDKINDRAALEARGVDVSEAVAWATRAFLHQMFRDYFFHCDPHPGNLLVDREGRVAIIDFGMHESIAPEIMDGMRMNVLAAVTRNETLWVDSMIRIGILRESDRDEARELARLSFDPAYYNLTPRELSEIDLGDYFGRLRGHLWMLRSFRMPEGLVAWGRAFSLLYGLALELAPGLRPLDVVGPYVLGFLQAGAPREAQPSRARES
ncbi:MAG: AarF/ABC1/UbiB kinase family protein [Spirochaetaceae bacterium]|nr:AarF/ABC1/UbiB kinase family protein [Myxococcales bacterium]MCB9722852.1 AarF/ABC1/UbiB kinase family protein [Spirochaetaceae bacterium]